jgi:hypothetical protein
VISVEDISRLISARLAVKAGDLVISVIEDVAESACAEEGVEGKRALAIAPRLAGRASILGSAAGEAEVEPEAEAETDDVAAAAVEEGAGFVFLGFDRTSLLSKPTAFALAAKSSFGTLGC